MYKRTNDPGPLCNKRHISVGFKVPQRYKIKTSGAGRRLGVKNFTLRFELIAWRGQELHLPHCL